MTSERDVTVKIRKIPLPIELSYIGSNIAFSQTLSRALSLPTPDSLGHGNRLQRTVSVCRENRLSVRRKKRSNTPTTQRPAHIARYRQKSRASCFPPISHGDIASIACPGGLRKTLARTLKTVCY